MAPSNNKAENPSTPIRTGNLTHRRHHSIANDTINDIVGSMNVGTVITAPSSAPRMGRLGGRHNRHATHSHIDLESALDNEEVANWSMTSKKSSAIAMAQYLDNVESSDQVHDICSFQDVDLNDAENGTPKHHRHTNSLDSFHSSGSNNQGVPRRARRMYYLMPMMWKHRYPIAACVATFLVCVIVISTSVHSSMKNVNSKGNSSWKDTTNNNEALISDAPPKMNDMEMVGPPLEASVEDVGSDNSGKQSSTIHQPQQPPPQKDDQGGALILGPGGVYEEETTSSRTPCMTSHECEARADLLGFPTFEVGPFVDKGCSYQGSVVYWGAGATTTNDDEEDNDLTLEELTQPLTEDSNKVRLWCDDDETMIAIDKVTAALSIAEGNIDAEEGKEDTINEEDVDFIEIEEGDDPDGVAIVGENFGMEEDTGEEEVDQEGALTVGAPLQIESNPDDNTDAEWYSTDTELYTSFIADGVGPHETAMKFCESKGQSLCNYNDYCPEGKSSRVYQGGPEGNWIDNPAESEQWAPVLAHSDESATSEWVQVGKIVDGGDTSENFGLCWTYEAWVNRDDADFDVEDTIDESHRRFFLCCDN